MSFDLVVIGAGPGGYVAAIRARQLGFSVAVVDKDERLGGTCLNVGCIPSKALLDASEKIAWIGEKGLDVGLENPRYSLNFEKMMQEKEAIVDGLTRGVAHLFEKHRITYFQGRGAFLNKNEMEVVLASGKKETVSARYFLIATGSTPSSLPFLPFDEKKVLSSTGALALKQIPKSLLVVGGGVIGVELASVYKRLGSEVNVVEMLDVIVPAFDHAISKALLQILKKQGLIFHLGEKLLSAEVRSNGVLLKASRSEFFAEKVLVAIGRRPYTEGLGLEKIGISVNKQGQISVNSAFQTALPHIFAIGDVIDGPMLAHKASEEGIAAAAVMAGTNAELDYLTVPNVIYTSPEVASVGLTEEELKQSGLAYTVGVSYIKGNPRARASLEKEGIVKVLGDKKTGKLLGMHLIAPHASEMIALGSLAIKKRLCLKEVGEMPFSHPTISEAIKEALLGAIGLAIHG